MLNPTAYKRKIGIKTPRIPVRNPFRGHRKRLAQAEKRLTELYLGRTDETGNGMTEAMPFL